jgi:hypothetical protein
MPCGVPDKKCPFTSEVSIRGRILTGRVVSTKMTRTLIVRRDYLHYVPKYSAYRTELGVLGDLFDRVAQTVTRRGTRTSQRTSPPHSVSRLATRSPSVRSFGAQRH